MDREKVIKSVHDARRYLEDREWVDKSVGVHIDALNDALALIKEQDKIIQNILREKTNELNDKVETLQIELQNQEMRRLLEQK